MFRALPLIVHLSGLAILAGSSMALAGESHPRLFFDEAKIPEIRARAATSEGKAIVDAIRFMRDGGARDGEAGTFLSDDLVVHSGL